MAQHLKDSYLSRVGVIYLDNGFGRGPTSPRRPR